jgi:O-antigen/teichoic acid export membrane protein
MLKRLMAAIKEQDLWALFLRLSTAGVGAQLLALAVYPLISRLYGPEDFGIRATFAALFMLILPFSTLNLEFALPLVKERSEAGQVFKTSFLLTTALAFLLLIIVGVFYFGAWVAHPVIPFLWLLPIAIFLGGLRKVILGWASWLAHQRALVHSKYWRAGTKSLMELIGGWWQANIWFLVSSQVVGILAMLVYLYGQMRSDLHQISMDLRNTDWRAVLFRYRGYPAYTVPSTFADIFNTHFPLLFFGTFLSLELAGQFSMAMLLIYLVFSSLGDAFSQAYLVELGKYIQQGRQDIRSLFGKSLRVVSLTAIGISLGIALLGEPVLLWVLGPQWEPAAGMLPMLSLLVPVYFWSALCFHTLNKISAQGLILLVYLSRAAVLLVLFFVFYLGGSPEERLILVYVVNTFFFGLLFVGLTYFFIQNRTGQ